MHDALNDQTTNQNPVHEVLLVPCRKVRPFTGQPRTFFDRRSLQELADSIAEIGQTTPCLVRRLDPPEDGYEFELADGERRQRACVMLGRLLKIEIDPDVGDVKKQFKKSVAANFGREGHTPVESARAIQKLRENGESIEAVARLMGRSMAWVNQYSNLLKLDSETLVLLQPEKTAVEHLITVSVALQLVGVPMPTQLELAKRISQLQLSMDKARHLIRATLEERGLSGNSEFRPARELGRISTSISKSVEHLEEFTELSEAKLRLILKGAGLQKRMALLEKTASLVKCAEQFEKILKNTLQMK